MPLIFEWDSNKDKQNINKHKVSFEEAKSVFGDPLARISEDKERSTFEDRWHIIGYSKFNQILIVAYTERNNVIRIITSRKANKTEIKNYEKNNFQKR
jgi:uncharacterized protein